MLSPTHLSDRELASRIRAADANAFEILFRRHAETLVRFAISIVKDSTLAEDVVQEVFGSVWSRRAEWEVPDDVLAYLIGAVRKNILHKIRTGVHRDQASAKYVQSGTSPGLGAMPVPPDHRTESLDQAGCIWEIVLALSEPRRTILIARWLHGLEWAEVANQVGLSVEATKKQHARTLIALRPSFEKFR